MSDYQKRTPERLIEILRSSDQNPRSWNQEAADVIDGLLLWQRARLEIHDILGAEIASLRAQLAKSREALEFIRDGYDRIDINHVDFRVGAYKAALTALSDEAKA